MVLGFLSNELAPFRCDSLSTESYIQRSLIIVTRLNMLFIPTLPVKVEFTAMIRILSWIRVAKGAVQCCAILILTAMTQ